MKYTRNESGEVIEVKGCATCPHMEKRSELLDGPMLRQTTFMFCVKPHPGQKKFAGRKLTSNWTGPYHASCPLASSPEMVPALKANK